MIDIVEEDKPVIGVAEEDTPTISIAKRDRVKSRRRRLGTPDPLWRPAAGAAERTLSTAFDLAGI